MPTCLASLLDRPGGRLVVELLMVVKLCENTYMGGSGNVAFVAVRPKLFQKWIAIKFSKRQCIGSTDNCKTGDQ